LPPTPSPLLTTTTGPYSLMLHGDNQPSKWFTPQKIAQPGAIDLPLLTSENAYSLDSPATRIPNRIVAEPRAPADEREGTSPRVNSTTVLAPAKAGYDLSAGRRATGEVRKAAVPDAESTTITPASRRRAVIEVIRSGIDAGSLPSHRRRPLCRGSCTRAPVRGACPSRGGRPRRPPSSRSGGLSTCPQVPDREPPASRAAEQNRELTYPTRRRLAKYVSHGTTLEPGSSASGRSPAWARLRLRGPEFSTSPSWLSFWYFRLKPGSVVRGGSPGWTCQGVAGALCWLLSVRWRARLRQLRFGVAAWDSDCIWEGLSS
jgi:hypothetical protein